MSKSKKIIYSILILLILIIIAFSYKLATTGFQSSYLKNKVSSYILEISSNDLEISNVTIKYVKNNGLILDIPSASTKNELQYHLRNTIIDINLLSILKKGLKNSDLHLYSNADFGSNKSVSIELFSNEESFTVNKILSTNFNISEPIVVDKNNLVNLDFNFTKNFIDNNFVSYIDTIQSKYNLNISDLFFDNKIFYRTSILIDVKNQVIYIKKLQNKNFIKIQASVDYSNKDIFVKLNLNIPTQNLSEIFHIILSSRDTNNVKILKTISDLSDENQNLDLNFRISNDLVPREIFMNASGKVNLDYQLDQNNDPSFLRGSTFYDINIYKKTVADDLYNISSNFDFTDANIYIRQINLIKKSKESLNLSINSNFDLKKDIELNIETIDSNFLTLNGKIKLNEVNDFIIDDFYVFNNDNADLKINAILTNRTLDGKISGKLIDLSKNKLSINDDIKNYYFKFEKYKIFTKKAFLSGGLSVDNFKVNIKKKKNQINVQSSGENNESYFTYSRKKDKKLDISVTRTDNIINSVGPKHSSRKIIKNGKADISTYRLIGSSDTNVEIELEDFVLINTPGMLKLLSLPSFSGISSVMNNESGIEFAYGKISYKVNDAEYSDINAYAVNDGVGLVLSGNINRKNGLMNIEGQISPLHLLSGIIQKIPIFGRLLIGNEGEGIVAVEYTMTGSQDNPDVTSNPLTIFKPRLFERTIDFFNNN